MNDVIYRQDAIDAFKVCATIGRGNGKSVAFKIANDYADIVRKRIDALQSAQQWIPCSEHLPKVDEPVLVTDDSGGIKTVDVDRCGQYENSNERFWYYTQNAVAWMPLPEPYRAERREE